MEVDGKVSAFAVPKVNRALSELLEQRTVKEGDLIMMAHPLESKST